MTKCWSILPWAWESSDEGYMYREGLQKSIHKTYMNEQDAKDAHDKLEFEDFKTSITSGSDFFSYFDEGSSEADEAWKVIKKHRHLWLDPKELLQDYEYDYSTYWDWSGLEKHLSDEQLRALYDDIQAVADIPPQYVVLESEVQCDNTYAEMFFNHPIPGRVWRSTTEIIGETEQ